MRIILLGASGQLGKEWQHYFRDNNAASAEDALIPYSSDQLDITNSKQLTEELQKQQPDVVINCAAYTDVDEVEEHRKLARRVNADAVSHLATIAEELGFQLVYYSTDYIFPGYKKDKEALPEGYPENHPADPVNWYGQTKWEGEQTVRQTTDNHLILRLSWLCGQFGQNFVKTVLKLGRERDQLQVVNDQWGSPSFAGNVVQNTLQLLKGKSAGTYHITSGGIITWYDFAKAILGYSNIDINIEAVSSAAFPTKADRPHFSKLNTKKIESVSDSEIIHWHDGLRDLLMKLDN